MGRNLRDFTLAGRVGAGRIWRKPCAPSFLSFPASEALFRNSGIVRPLSLPVQGIQGHCKVMEKCENLRYTILLLSCFFIRSLLFFHHPTLHCAVCRSGKLRIAAPFLAVIRGLALYISVISPLPWLHQTSIRKLHKARHFPLWFCILLMGNVRKVPWIMRWNSLVVAYILHQSYTIICILHPILHPKLSENTGSFRCWCRKCRIFL